MANKKILDEEKNIEILEQKILQEEGKIETVLNSPGFRKFMEAGDVLLDSI